MPAKDIVQMLEDADGEPQWMREVLQEIFNRLPPIPPPAPPAIEPPYWDPSILAKLHLDESYLPLSSNNRWHLASWLKELAEEFIQGTDEGNPYLFTLRHSDPSSGPREKRGRV